MAARKRKGSVTDSGVMAPVIHPVTKMPGGAWPQASPGAL